MPDAFLPSFQLYNSFMATHGAITVDVIGTAANTDLRAATLNINGLTGDKLDAIAWLVHYFNLDVLAVQDTRTTETGWPALRTDLARRLGPSAGFHMSPTMAATDASDPCIGGQLFIVSSRCGPVRYHPDPHGFGCIHRITFDVVAGALTIIGLYLPYKPASQLEGPSSKLYNKIQTAVIGTGVPSTPEALLQNTAVVWATRCVDRPQHDVIVLGDFNATWDAPNAEGRPQGGCYSLIPWAIMNGLINQPRRLCDIMSTSLTTHVQGPYQSWIDHALFVSSNRISNGNLFGALGGLLRFPENGQWDGAVSDHRPLICLLRLRPVEGDAAPIPLRQPTSTQLTSASQQARYTANMAGLATRSRQPTASSASGLVNSLTAQSTQFARDLNNRFQRGAKQANFFQGWSPTYMFWKFKVSFLTMLLRHLYGYQGHWVWPELPASSSQLIQLVNHWDASLGLLRQRNPELNELYANDKFGPSYWRTIPSLQTARLSAADHRRDVIRLMHGRKRTEWRCAISDRCAELEKHRAEGRIGKVIVAVTGSKSHPVDLAAINVAGVTITDPAVIHQTATLHFQQHHRHNGIADNRIFDWDDAAGIAASEQAFSAYYGPQLPPELQDTLPYLWKGFTHSWTDHPPAQVDAYRLELAN